MKERVESELERDGVLEKTNYGEWAAPAVTVPKPDGQLHLCGDYKVTVKPVLDVDQYPLPKPDDIFATLAGGKQFTTLDLSHAYNQLIMDEESWKFVTINTHKGLYQYTRLPFGIASATAVFQRIMDTILQGIEGVTCYIDDIIITGKSTRTLGAFGGSLAAPPTAWHPREEVEMSFASVECDFSRSLH